MLRFMLMLCLVCIATDIDAKPKKIKESKDPLVTSYCEFLTVPIADRFYVAIRSTPLKESPDEAAETITMVKKGEVGMAKIDEYSDELNPNYSNGYVQLASVGVAKIGGWASTKDVFSVLLLAPLEVLESGVFECRDNMHQLFAQAFGGTHTSRGFIPRSDIRTSEMLRHLLNQEKRYMYQMLRVVAKRFGREAHLNIIELLKRKYPEAGTTGYTIENLCPYQLEDPQNLKKPTSDPDKDF